MIHKISVLTLLLNASIGFSAIEAPKDNLSTLEALKLPAAIRIETLSQLGVSSYKDLREIAFNSNYGMKFQWRALSAMALIGREKSTPELEVALKHKDWFMRNAGLVMLKEVNPKAATTWAKKLLSDRSMIVRTEAVEVLRSLKDESSIQLLWTELYKKENFRGKQSLWIRRHIAQALGELSQRGDEKKFIKLLSDSDKTLHIPAITGLEKITNKRLGGSKDSLNTKVGLWQQWWKEQI